MTVEGGIRSRNESTRSSDSLTRRRLRTSRVLILETELTVKSVYEDQIESPSATDASPSGAPEYVVIEVARPERGKHAELLADVIGDRQSNIIVLSAGADLGGRYGVHVSLRDAVRLRAVKRRARAGT